MPFQHRMIKSYQEFGMRVLSDVGRPDTFVRIFSGIALFNFQENTGQWLKDTLVIEIPHDFQSKNTPNAELIATGALAQVLCLKASGNAGWAMNNIYAHFVLVDTRPVVPIYRLNVEVDLGVRDACISGVSFQVHVHEQINP